MPKSGLTGSKMAGFMRPAPATQTRSGVVPLELVPLSLSFTEESTLSSTENLTLFFRLAICCWYAAAAYVWMLLDVDNALDKKGLKVICSSCLLSG